MGAFSVWHWLVLLILFYLFMLLIAFCSYPFAEPDRRNKVIIGVILGAVANMVGGFLVQVGQHAIAPSMLWAGTAVLLIGTICFIYSAIQFAAGKGYEVWVGLLFGLIPCGSIVLLLLRDKKREAGFSDWRRPVTGFGLAVLILLGSVGIGIR